MHLFHTNAAAPASGDGSTACTACGEAAIAPRKLQRCTACTSVAYCNTACQRAHWRQHKPACAKLKKQRVARVMKDHGYPTLVHACGAKDLPAVRAIVDAGADASKLVNGFAPLGVAAEVSDQEVDMVKYLVEHGKVPINQAAPNGFTATMTAAQEGNMDCLRYLVQNGGDVDHANEQGESATYVAAMHNRAEAIVYLAAQGADTAKARHDGFTPMLEAARGAAVEAVRALKGLGLVLDDAPAGDQGRTATMHLAHCGSLEGLKLLSEEIADWDVNQEDPVGCTPIMFAIKGENRIQCVKWLLAKGADVNRMGIGSVPMLSMGVMMGSLEVVRMLLKAGADAGHRLEDGSTAASGARWQGHVDIAKVIEAVAAAGSWGGYVSALRLPHLLIRLRVARADKVLPVGHDDRELLHFVYGKPADDEEGDDDRPPLAAPDDVFETICRFLQS